MLPFTMENLRQVTKIKVRDDRTVSFIVERSDSVAESERINMSTSGGEDARMLVRSFDEVDVMRRFLEVLTLRSFVPQGRNGDTVWYWREDFRPAGGNMTLSL